MKSKVIVITGGSDGIGLAAARHLSGDGHRVIVVGRTPEKTEAMGHELVIETYVADFAKFSEVHALADKLREQTGRIDVLAHNAGGIFGGERRMTQDGHEITFQVNYLASFLLTHLLLDRLIESRATIVFTSSQANNLLGAIDPDDLENERNFSPVKAYANSKLAQILLARELHRRYWRRGLASAAFHPGNIASNFGGERGASGWALYHTPLRSWWAASPEKGADTLVFLAESAPGVIFPSGEYFAKRKVARANKQANDRLLANELWNRSEAMIGSVVHS